MFSRGVIGLLALGACQFDGNVPQALSTDADAAADAPPVSAGLALSFDGNDDFVRVNRTIADDFTIEAWIQTTESRGGGRFWEGRGLVYSDVGGDTNDFGTAILNDHFAFGIGPSNATIESTSVVTTGEWVHVAAVRTRATGVIRVLVNGEEEATSITGNTGPLDANAKIDIGGNTIDRRFFGGMLDEVRIWNIPRSNAAIQASMRQSLPADEPNLIGYWRFDDAGGDAIDATATVNHGALGDGSQMQSPRFVNSDAPLQ